MNWIIPLQNVRNEDRPKVGGKGFALACMLKGSFNIPDAICITTEAYDQFVTSTGLRERILLELNRKDLNRMRWEEIWDCAIRIRSMFLSKPIPADLAVFLRKFIESRFKNIPVVIRSSAQEEDSVKASFAGLHESFVNIQGTDLILDHIQKVWASLWSDAALLYRQELGLDVQRSSMAVVIQEIIIGQRSGVAFTQSPNDESQAIVESVYGLNQGMVDGSVAPDRWIFDRSKNKIISYTPVHRDRFVVPSSNGVRTEFLPDNLKKLPPLSDQEALRVLETSLKMEKLFKVPQDVEWTIRNSEIFILQSRPITTVSEDHSKDKQHWYLSLHRSFDNLRALRDKIEKELVPGMIKEASLPANQDLKKFSDEELANEINRRLDIYRKWVDIYWADFIPFAHGIRLFGQVYNDVIRPEDPYEFMDLLSHRQLVSLERNQMLEDMAIMIRNDSNLAQKLKNRMYAVTHKNFQRTMDEFIKKFGDLSCTVTGATQCSLESETLIHILLEMAAHPPVKTARTKSKDIESLKDKFLNQFERQQKTYSIELLDLACASYQMRDNDNIYLGRIEAQMLAAVNEGKLRLKKRGIAYYDFLASEELIKALKHPKYLPEKPAPKEIKNNNDFKIQARQLIGQPAGPGLSQGMARVILNLSDLSNFRYGEIMVCDSVDPNMTFVVPLAAGIVERRGGMLVHGAIIAREYGLPCVTGIFDATSLIQTGDILTVDGYLGIVTITKSNP